MLYHTLLVRLLTYDWRSWCRAMSTVGALLAFLLVASAAAAGVLSSLSADPMARIVAVSTSAASIWL